MTAALSAADRTKLAKLLAMLGSDYSNERDNAAQLAHRLVKNAGLTWGQVLRPPPVEKKLPLLGTWRGIVAELLKYPHELRPWELVFLRDLPQFQRLSVKQRYCLKEISSRVLREPPL